MRGLVFDMQRYSLHDGPGVRTNLFLKGCTLRCAWCSNPESHRPLPEIAFFGDLCFGCGDCLSVCPTGSLEPEGTRVRWSRSLCNDCGACVRVCPAGVFRVVGEEITATEAIARVVRDSAFYTEGGGLTLTGGEPALQPGFAQEVLRLAHKEGLHTALETCGHVPWLNLQSLLPYLDLVLYDIKHLDPQRHRDGTGASNQLILDNARRMAASEVSMVVRVPLIPGFNANREDLSAIARYVIELKSVHEVHVLPYHSLGRAKYRSLGRHNPMGDALPMTAEEADALADVIRSYGLCVRVGG